MADVLHMPPRPRQKGRRRVRPIEGEPLAQTFDFHVNPKPTPAEVKDAIQKLALAVVQAARATKVINRAMYPDD